MPSDDLILNVRQIAQYSPASSAPTTASILMQTNGLGSAYASISPADLVGSALAFGGDMAVAGKLSIGAVQGGSAQFSNGAFGFLSGQKGCFDSISAGCGSIGGSAIATMADLAALAANTVSSFNGRQGAVCLWIQDILNAGGAPLWSPVFGGQPRAPTPSPSSNSTRLATTAFVQTNAVLYIDNLLKTHPFVFTFNGRTGDIVLTAQDIIAAGGEGEIFDSPNFTGIPTAPTAAPGTDTNQVATTAFVMNAVAGGPFAPLNSPVFTGVPQGPTAAAGSSTGQLATTAFVMNAVAESVTGVASFNTRTGNVVLEAADITSAGGALLASPTFTGIPAAPTPAPGTNTTQLATTAYVTAALAAISGGVTSFNTRTGAVSLNTTDITSAGGALLISPAFTGIPTAPTAGPNVNTTQIATCAFVMSELANAAVQSFNGRVGAVTLTSADISAAGGAALQSPAFLGTPTAPTPAPGSNSTAIATTAFVEAALAGAGVTSFNGRTGVVLLSLADITGAGGAPLASPSFSGTPTGPTAAPGNSSQQLATTQFVTAALAGGAGVSSFNTRTGAVTLTIGDITGAGGAPLSGPAFTGSPTAPTPTAGNSSTALATTAFVQNAITTGSVATFNGRVGAVTLTSADVSAAGGALLASPALTGTPTGPTASPGTNSGQLATTAFVAAAVGASGGVTSFNGRAGVVTLSNADVIGVLPSSATNPTMNGTAAPGSSGAWSRGDHVHPTDTSLVPLAGGTMTGRLTVPAITYSAGVTAGNVLGLVVAGGAQIAQFWNTTTGYLSFYINAALIDTIPYGYTAGSFFGATRLGFNLATLQGYAVNNNGNGFYIAVTSASDRRMKSAIAPASRSGVETINSLGVYEFDLDQPGCELAKHWDFGLMADEVLEAVPPAFVPASDAPGSFQSLRELPLVAALVKAVQELSSRIATLEARLA